MAFKLPFKLGPRQAGRSASSPAPGKEPAVRAIPALAGRKWAVALLVKATAQYGSARQYDAYAESFSTDHIFYDLETAMEWLREQHP